MTFAAEPTVSPPYVCDKTFLHLYIHKDTCIFVAQDNSLQPGGYIANPWINTRSHYFAGIKTSTGYDRISHVFFPRILNDAQIEAKGLLNLTGVLGQDCRTSKNAYKLAAELIDPSGNSINSLGVKQTYTESKSYTVPADSYCFATRCGTTSFSTAFYIPANAKPGPYSLKIYVESTPDVLGLGLETVSGVATYSNRLVLSPGTTDVSDWIAELSVSNVKSKPIVFLLEPTPLDEVDAYKIQKYEWRIKESKSKKVIDTFFTDEPSVNSPVGFSTKIGKVSVSVDKSGQTLIRYQLRKQKQNLKYLCEIRAVTPTGLSKWDGLTVIPRTTL